MSPLRGSAKYRGESTEAYTPGSKMPPLRGSRKEMKQRRVGKMTEPELRPRMISDTLIPVLYDRFPERRMRVEHSPRPRIVFPAEHPEVGNVVISDDGDEATVEVGSTHGHFNPYNAELSDAELAQAVTEMVAEFLTLLFADRVLLYRSSAESHFGGWRIFSEPVRKIPAEFRGYLVFIWSGPLTH